MNKIDIIKWHNYKIGDLFKIESAKGKNSQQLNDGNDIPYIAASKERNGFNRMVSKEGFENWISEGNCIQLIHIGDAAAGYANYIPNKFIAMSGKSSCAYNKNMTKYSGLFIAAIISKTNMHKYSFKDPWTGDKVKNTVITLPYKTNTEPDWEYMESYMKNIMQESERDIKNLQNISVLKMDIQTEKWGSFKCSKLFTARNTGNILARDVENGSGKTPYVTASGINNGVFAHIDASKYDIIKGHCILIGGKTFTVTYQADNFVSNDSHNFVIRTLENNISDLSYKYLVTVIRSYLGQKYSWNDAVTKDKFLNENIPLPAKLNGQPDWKYMENYMKNIMDDTKAKLNILKTCYLRI